ncbi:uncharacterized protein LOC119089937 [Pollicipes pollicipes]|uniref:uncharacterized protein LOC119089937 n=1 Tax=Pollicipes pollicipes TaxID=41117 RepID=UPI001884DE3E|nr:uncharacterized protein LOC119089937 [Pollicipes pollicipes]
MQEMQKQEMTFRSKTRELESKLKELNSQITTGREENREKEREITSLKKIIHNLESSSAEQQRRLEAHEQLLQDGEVLARAVREVAQLAAAQAEPSEQQQQPQEGEGADRLPVLVQATALVRTPYGPATAGSPVPAVTLAESTVMAVQAVLNRQQLRNHELQTSP